MAIIQIGFQKNRLVSLVSTSSVVAKLRTPEVDATALDTWRLGTVETLADFFWGGDQIMFFCGIFWVQCMDLY